MTSCVCTPLILTTITLVMRFRLIRLLLSPPPLFLRLNARVFSSTGDLSDHNQSDKSFRLFVSCHFFLSSSSLPSWSRCSFFRQFCLSTSYFICLYQSGNTMFLRSNSLHFSLGSFTTETWMHVYHYTPVMRCFFVIFLCAH